MGISIPDTNISTARQRLIYFCFFLSGATGLIYQVIWARQLGLILGNTMYAITLVVAVFMAGLALGSYLVSKVLKSYPQPLKAYAVMELGIGLWAFATPFLLKGVDYLYIKFFPVPGSSLFTSTLLRFGLSGLTLLVPTMLMGGTLPALTTYLTPRLEELGNKLSALYAVNTLGAVVGTWWVGFYALPWLGINLSNITAALINIAIGIFFISSKQICRPLMAKARADQVLSNNKTAYFLLGGILVAGFSAMIYEIAWTRTLIVILGSSTYAFSCILMAFLVGIALGSFIYKMLQTKFAFSLTGFCVIEILIGTFSLLSLPAFSYLPRAYLILYHLLPEGSWVIQGLRFLIPMAIMIIPATLMGITLPLAGELYARETGDITSGVGNIYGASTLGSVFGAIVAGFILLTVLGVHNSLKLAIILNLFIGTAGILISKPKAAVFLAGASLLIGVSTIYLPSWDKYLLSSAVSIYTDKLDPFQPSEKWMHQNEILYYKEGLNGVVAAYQLADGDIFLRINGKSDASNIDSDMPTQLLLGYVPLLLHPDPQNALVIGLGSGITARAVAQYDFIQQVDSVEIEPAVVEAARLFDLENHNILKNPKVKIIIDDARTYLKRPYQPYDLIISEPPNPWMKGVGNLFSTDFYKLCRDKLKDNGIMCQWIHCYGISPEIFKMAVNSFRQSFPYCQLWYIPAGDALIIGSERPLNFDLERVAQLINYNPGIKKEMKKDLGVDSATGLLGYFMLNNKEISNFTKGASLNTDNYPRLEFAAPYDLSNVSTRDLNYQIITSYRITGLPDNIKLHDKTDAMADYYYGTSRIFFLGYNKNEAYNFINKAIEYNDQDARFFLARGRIHLHNKNFMPAIDDFKRSLELDPKNHESYMELATLLESQKRWGEAQGYYLKALELAPDNHELLFKYAHFLSYQGKKEQAITMAGKLTSSADLKTYKVWEFIGDLYGILNNLDKARAAYNKSYQLNTSNYMVRIKLGEVDFVQGRESEALKKFERSRDMFEFYQPKEMGLLFLISNCYLRLGQYDKAAETYREILKKDPGNLETYQRLSTLLKRD